MSLLKIDLTLPGMHCSELGVYGTSAVEGYAAIEVPADRYAIVEGVESPALWTKDEDACLPCHGGVGKCCNDCYALRYALVAAGLPRSDAKQHPQCQQGCRVKTERMMPPGNGVIRFMSNRLQEDRSVPGRLT